MASAESRVFIDASILLDIILPDRPRLAVASRYMSGEHNKAISTLSVHLAVQFGKKFELRPADIRPTLELLAILPVERHTVSWAFAHFKGKDFEDALQVACAVLNGCREFVTADFRLAKNYGRFIDIQLLT